MALSVTMLPGYLIIYLEIYDVKNLLPVATTRSRQHIRVKKCWDSWDTGTVVINHL